MTRSPEETPEERHFTTSRTELNEIDRQARAYGWEIGHGQALSEVVTTSPDNPFLDPDWRDKISKEQP